MRVEEPAAVMIAAMVLEVSGMGLLYRGYAPFFRPPFIWRRLRPLGMGIGGDGGLPGAGGIDGGLGDKTILIEFPHFGFGDSAYFV
jgi:hypothetical protein